MGDFKGALKNFAIAIQLKPNLAEAYNNIATIFMKIRRTSDAIDMIQKAIHFKPLFAEAHNNLGNAYKSLGCFEAATKSYQMALKSRPLFAEAFFNLTQINQFNENEPLLKIMDDILKDPKSTQNDKMLLSFSLGKTFDDINQPEIAYKYFSDGNAIRRSLSSYNLINDIDLAARIKRYFRSVSRFNYQENSFFEKTHLKPIFVVGMPRSGTTLVEQILASHSDVYAAGELPILGELVNNIDFRKSYQHINLINEIRIKYLTYLEKFDNSAVNVVDKMPLNFFWVGIIIATIPEARIIHVKRDARATCWSIYKQLFANVGTEFSYDFEDLIGFYKLYIDLMKFWHQTFPDKIYDLNYDELTINQEFETRSLLEHLDLEFMHSCLDFQNTKRQIDTASASQVRQKMYKGSSKSWLKYKNHLSYLIRSLKDY